ncbi:seven-hairpin glycosidase [Hesseltinella vesiculosa]|uniref:alpha-1,2-Mannosidase n=1 Tax=Hesseltinella vesiculosa TaxID=101127 RepID=A0A1X2GIY6_9FUNG|nr:seven-hairpin glycosidase [Hesseltinella vesiculosa]
MAPPGPPQPAKDNHPPPPGQQPAKDNYIAPIRDGPLGGEVVVVYVDENGNKVDEPKIIERPDLAKSADEPEASHGPIWSPLANPPPLPRIQYDFEPEPPAFASLRTQRQQAVKGAFAHAWNGYRQYAMGHDELKPLTNGTSDPFAHWGATLIDSLDTMLIMGMQDEFLEALVEVEKVEFKTNSSIIVFETIIRYLGGLLSAYELSNEQHPILINKAYELGKLMAPAFDSPTGIYPHTWNPTKPEEYFGSLTADLSMHMELFALSYHSKDNTFARLAQNITNKMQDMNARGQSKGGSVIPGLYPTGIDTRLDRFTDYVVRLGAMGDSWFEYLIKHFVYVEGALEQYRDMYVESMDSVKKYVLAFSPGSDMIFIPSYNTFTKMSDFTMDHLACFVPGMLAVGAKILDRPEDMDLAKGSLETCVHMYRSSATGLGPERWGFNYAITYDRTLYEMDIPKQKAPEPRYQVNYPLPEKPERYRSIQAQDRNYHLRPETVESLYVLYRLTGDQKYQEYAWEIFEAIEKNCKTPSGYAAIMNVDWLPGPQELERNQADSMESFLLAETFKYLYLIFSPPDVISLDDYVFNTEAHPLRRRSTWTWGE